MIVAASRDQAGIMLRQVQRYVRRSTTLRERLKVVQRAVRDERTGGRIRVLAADSDTLDGQIPTLAVIDEWLGRRPKRPMEYPATGFALVMAT